MPNLSQKVYITLHLSPREVLKYYSGSAKYVQTNSSDGQIVRFPANIIQQYVTNEGIHGEFVLEYDKKNKFCNIKKVNN